MGVFRSAETRLRRAMAATHELAARLHRGSSMTPSASSNAFSWQSTAPIRWTAHAADGSSMVRDQRVLGVKGPAARPYARPTPGTIGAMDLKANVVFNPVGLYTSSKFDLFAFTVWRYTLVSLGHGFQRHASLGFTV